MHEKTTEQLPGTPGTRPHSRRGRYRNHRARPCTSRHDAPTSGRPATPAGRPLQSAITTVACDAPRSVTRLDTASAGRKDGSGSRSRSTDALPESVANSRYRTYILERDGGTDLRDPALDPAPAGSTLARRLVRRADAKTSPGGSRHAAAGLDPLADAVVRQLLQQLPRWASRTVRTPVRPRRRSEPARCLAHDPYQFVVFD